MKAIIDFTMSILIGLALHQTSSLTQKMPVGWRELTGPAIGVIGSIPSFLLWLYGLDPMRRKNPYTWSIAAYLISFLGVGVGVAIGWISDTILNIDRSKA